MFMELSLIVSVPSPVERVREALIPNIFCADLSTSYDIPT
jgi:hypothetical protein